MSVKCIHGKLALAILWLTFLFVSPSFGWAQEFPIRMPAKQPPTDARTINDYADAIDAIVWVMVNKFSLPVPRGTVEVHATRESYEKGLIKHLKIHQTLAGTVSEFSKSAVGNHTLLINGPVVADLSWPERIELLAHEVTHNLQLTLAKRSGIERPQWLIEGYAEWMAFNITDALGLDVLGHARARMIEKLRKLKRNGILPNLLKIETFADWAETREKYGFDATYPLAFLVTDFLIERHSFAAVTGYFRQFEISQDHSANFRMVLGEEIDEFGHALQHHLEQLLGKGEK